MFTGLLFSGHSVEILGRAHAAWGHPAPYTDHGNDWGVWNSARSNAIALAYAACAVLTV